MGTWRLKEMARLMERCNRTEKEVLGIITNILIERGVDLRKVKLGMESAYAGSTSEVE